MDGICGACGVEIGTDLHCLHECDSLVTPIALRHAEGRLRKQPRKTTEAGMAPLMQMALPPVACAWEPVEIDYKDGALSQDVGGDTFGDGSGYHQQEVATRIATCSAVRLRFSDEGNWTLAETTREVIGGWFPTVPRGEITALITHLRHTGTGSTYWGDCKHVIDVANAGVPEAWASSVCANADLWREVRRLLADHGGNLTFRKVAAHRARAAAEIEGETALMAWIGNDAADVQARSLARSIAEADPRQEATERLREVSAITLDRVGVAAALAFRGRPNLRRRRVGLKDPTNAEGVEKHIFRRRGNDGWECGRCHAYWNCDRARRLAEKSPCSGDIQQRVHPSHAIQREGSVLWCSKCGCYATRWPRKLRAQCPARPMSEAQRNVKKRLQRALMPTTAGYLNIETGFLGVMARVDQREGDDAAQASGASNGRYRRLIGGSLYRAPGGTQPRALSLEAARAGHHLLGHHLHHLHRDGDGCHAGCLVASGRESVIAADVGIAMDVSGGETHIDLLQAAPTFEPSSDRVGSQDCVPQESRSGNTVQDRGAASGRRRLNSKTSPSDAWPTTWRQSCAVGVSATRPHASKCAHLAGGSWAARLTASTVSTRAKCTACGACTRTRCRGCLRPLCIACARNDIVCGD